MHRENQIFQPGNEFFSRNYQPDSFAERALHKALDFFRQTHEVTFVSWAYLRALRVRVTGMAYWQKSFWSNMIYGGHDMAYHHYRNSVAQEYTLYRRELLNIILEQPYQGECLVTGLVQYLENAEAWALGAPATGASLQHLQALRFIVSKLTGCDLSACPFDLMLSSAQQLIQSDLLERFLKIPAESLRHLVENRVFSDDIFSQNQQLFLIYCLSAANEGQFLTRCFLGMGKGYQQHLFAIEMLLEQNSLREFQPNYFLTKMHSAQRWLMTAFDMASRHLNDEAQRESCPRLNACLKDGLFFEISDGVAQQDLRSPLLYGQQYSRVELDQQRQNSKELAQLDEPPLLENICFTTFSHEEFQGRDLKSLPMLNLSDIDLQYAEIARNSQAIADAIVQIIAAHHQYHVSEIEDMAPSDQLSMVNAGSQSISNSYHSPCQKHQRKKEFVSRFCAHYVFEPTCENINTFAAVIDIIDPEIGIRFLELLNQFPDVDKPEKLSSFLQHACNHLGLESQQEQYESLQEQLADRNERARSGLLKG